MMTEMVTDRGQSLVVFFFVGRHEGVDSSDCRDGEEELLMPQFHFAVDEDRDVEKDGDADDYPS